MVSVVGISGWRGSGKDTAGSFLVNELGYERDSFASTLKDCVALLFNWDREMLEGLTPEARAKRLEPDVWWEEKLDWANMPGSKINPRFTPIIALQYIGTDVLRNHFHNDIWLLTVLSRIRNKDKIVVTDSRFPNELNFIKNIGGVTIHIKKGPDPEWLPIAKQACSNDGTIDMFNAQNIMRVKYPEIHESEWRWVNWQFDHVVENNGTIDDLYTKLRNITTENIHTHVGD